jgi:hypothetical protein
MPEFTQLDEGGGGSSTAASSDAKPGSGASHKPGPKGDGKSGIAGAVFNLANAIIGAGVGGMPYALKLAGFWGGLALIAVVASCSDYTVRLIVTLSRKTHSKYYEDLVSSQFGHKGYLFVVGAMGIFAYGAMVAYLMGIGEAAPRAPPPPPGTAPSPGPLLTPHRPPPPLPPRPRQATTWPSWWPPPRASTSARTCG